MGKIVKSMQLPDKKSESDIKLCHWETKVSRSFYVDYVHCSHNSFSRQFFVVVFKKNHRNINIFYTYSEVFCFDVNLINTPTPWLTQIRFTH